MKTKTYRIKSPAKINIGLYVLNKRRDGYHNIETIFYPVQVRDELIIRIGDTDSPNNKITVKTNPKSGIDDKNNICYKAVKLFFREFRIRKKYEVEIDIKKIIPIGAGLGGGSSNAATVLKVLSKHFKKENNTSKIKNIALRLGSDVPFFLLGKPAYATSRGEKLTPLPKFKINYKILITSPNIHISTKWTYNQLNIKRQLNMKRQKHALSGAEGTKGRNRITLSLNKTKRFSLKDKEKYKNDFEEVVFKKYTAIRKLKEKMYNEGAALSLMTGSGSSVFGFFEKNINRISKYFRDKGYTVFFIRK